MIVDNAGNIFEDRRKKDVKVRKDNRKEDNKNKVSAEKKNKK